MPRCKLCKQKFVPKQFLQKHCFENDECIKAEIDLRSANKWKAEKKVLKEKIKNLSDYEGEARRVFQKWIRERDKHLPCISCNNSDTDQWDAGHLFKAELYSGLIFHEDNVHKQCKQCNHRLHGNEINYRIGLVKRIGIERVEWLENHKDRLRIYKYTKDELIEIKNKYQKLIK